MLKQYGFDAPVKRIHKNLPHYLPSAAVCGAVALLVLGGGLLYALPDHPEETTAAAATTASAPMAAASADESFCDKQTWPYIDQRCAARIESARGSRQVRIVTDKGTSVKTVTALPVVEQKPAPQPPKPVAAQNDRPIGPAVAPAAANPAEPQTTASVQPAMVSSPAPDATKAMASGNVPPASASNTPISPGVDAIDNARPQSKRERAAERAEKREAEKTKKREAKRRKIETDDDTADVAETVSDPRGDRSRSRRARAEVPNEVIEAVEAATARDRGRTVTIESPRGRRVYVVPSDGSSW